MALQKQIVDIPLASGVNTKADERALEAPALAVCIDAEFEDIGGIQTRKPFVAITNHASNTLTGIRKLATYDNELVAFTKDKIWSYASGDGLWTQRAEYLAPKVTEQARFVTTAEQFDCDRAELGGITMYCWSETTPSGTLSYVAAVDSATGSVKMTPTVITNGNSDMVIPRLVVTTNKIMLFAHRTTTERLLARAYDPSDLTSADSLLTVASLQSYDAAADGASAVVALNFNTSWSLYAVSETPSWTLARSRTVTVGGDSLALAVDTVANEYAVLYPNGTNLYVDFTDNVGASINDDVLIGTYPLAADVEYLGLQFDGVDTFHGFWSDAETDTTIYDLKTNTAKSDTTTGAQSTLVRRCCVGSKPFVHDSAMYIWVVFACANQGTISAQLQNSYFLYRSDGKLIAKAATTVAGGLPSIGILPTVQSLGSNKYAFCGNRRRIVTLGSSNKGYSARSPQDIVVEFDSDDARRTAQLGDTLYITGGQVAMYDGTSLAECGFHVYPWYVGGSTATGTNLTGSYSWKRTFSWYNAKGELERSTTATITTLAGFSGQQADILGAPLHTTLKTGSAGEIGIETWRTEQAAAVGAPFYLVSSKDPAVTGDNKYEENDPTATTQTFSDDMSDATLITKEINPENGGLILENLAPPPASIIHATEDRLFLAGIPGHPYRMVYSKLRGQGEIAAFHDALYVELPPDGGAITAIAWLNETLIVFKERAVYALPGDGFDNAGSGQNYGPSRVLANDVGAASADTIALTPRGLVFKSNKGWYLLNRGWSANYIGGPVSDFDTDTFTSVHTLEDQHQVRCCSTSRILTWDYLVNQWSEWSPSDLVHSAIYSGTHHYASDSGTGDDVLAQEANWDNNTTAYGLDLESAWIKTSGLQGFQRIRKLIILGEYASACTLRVRIAYDYDDSSWTDDKHWTISPTTVGGPMQVMHAPSKQKCQAFKVRITARNTTPNGFPTGEAFKLTGLQLEYRVKQGRFKNLPVTQKQ